MKILKSMPNDTAFFERYADLTHSLTKVATIAQVVTGSAEIGILYALLFPSIHDLAPNYAATLSTIAALFCAALLQFGLKKVFPYAVRAFIYKRWQGLDRAFSVSVIILTLALLGVSVFLSWNGSKDIAAFAIAPPTEKTTTAQDSAKRTATAQDHGKSETTFANQVTIRLLRNEFKLFTIDVQVRNTISIKLQQLISHSNFTIPLESVELRSRHVG